MSKSSNFKKIVIVGDVMSGKTCMWQSYFCQRLPSDYIETIFDNYTASVSYNGKEQMQLSLFDTCGEDDYFELRRHIYPGTDVIIFCVAIDNPSIIKDKHSVILEKWCNELKQNCKGIPILLVGTKKDSRDDVDALLQLAEKKLKPLKNKDLASISKKIKAYCVLECSAITGDGLKQVFQTAMKLALKNKSR